MHGLGQHHEGPLQQQFRLYGLCTDFAYAGLQSMLYLSFK